MKKKLGLFLVGMCMAVAIVGCGKKEDTSSTNGSNSGSKEDATEASDSKKATDAKYFEYTVENNEVTIENFTRSGKEKEIIVPDKIEGYPVVAVDTNAFCNDEKLEKIKLPSTVRRLGDTVFGNDTNLVEVNGTENIVEYGTSCFLGTNISELTLSPDIISIGDMGLCIYPNYLSVGDDLVFNDNFVSLGINSLSNLNCKTITFPASLLVINYISYCPNLETVTISEGTTTIESKTFLNCPKLTTVTIPASVTIIGEDILGGCDNVTIIAPTGSAAETYATANGIKFQAQ